MPPLWIYIGIIILVPLAILHVALRKRKNEWLIERKQQLINESEGKIRFFNRKAVKIIDTVLSLIVVGFIVAFVAVGAWSIYEIVSMPKRQRQNVNEQMSGFRFECEEYFLTDDSEADEIPENSQNEEEFVLKGKPIFITYNKFDSFFVRYDGIETEISDSFMKETSQVYGDIHRIWDEWDKKNGFEITKKKSETVRVFVYDDELFIITDGWVNGIWDSIGRAIPVLLFKYDIQKNRLYYCDYDYVYDIRYIKITNTFRRDKIL